MNTSCGNCIFATYDGGNQQTGCKANRLEKFAKAGCNIPFMEENGKIYCCIEDRICNMLCTKEKVERHNMRFPLEEMRQLIKIQYGVFILAEEEHTFEQICETINSLFSQSIQPKEINVILNTDGISRAKLVRFFKEKEDLLQELKWNVIHILDKGEDGSRNSVEWALDYGVSVSKYQQTWLVVFQPGFKVPTTYLSRIDKLINDDLERFSIVLPVDDWNCAFIQTTLYKSLDGNIPEVLEQEVNEEGKVISDLVATSIMDKIEYKAKEANQLHMIRKAQEICPELAS